MIYFISLGKPVNVGDALKRANITKKDNQIVNIITIPAKPSYKLTKVTKYITTTNKITKPPIYYEKK